MAKTQAETLENQSFLHMILSSPFEKRPNGKTATGQLLVLEC
jgi:hypothetical protein